MRKEKSSSKVCSNYYYFLFFNDTKLRPLEDNKHPVHFNRDVCDQIFKAKKLSVFCQGSKGRTDLRGTSLSNTPDQTKSGNYEVNQNLRRSSYLCALSLLFHTGMRVQDTMSPSAFEYIVEIENKSRCDILARRPFFSGYGKIEPTATQPLLIVRWQEGKPHSPNVTSKLVFCYIWSEYFIILCYFYKGNTR